MPRALLAAIVSSVAMLSSGSSAFGSQDAIPSQWFKTPGGWAYCTQPLDGSGDLPLLLCFSTVTGRWIRADTTRVPGKSNDQARPATGRDPRYVGFRRPGTTTVKGAWYDDRPHDSLASCSVTTRYLRCWAMDVQFWMKRGGDYRILG